MLPMLLSLGLGLSFEVPDRPLTPLSLEQHDVAAVLQAGESCFVAENLSEAHQLLFLGSRDIGLAPAVRLAPGARLVFPFPRGSAEGVHVELLSLGDQPWRSSGALALADIDRAPQLSVWIVRGSDGLSAWLEGPRGLESVQPRAGLLPPAIQAMCDAALHAPFATPALAPTHVPVPMPRQGRRGVKPPVIEKQPLPPV